MENSRRKFLKNSASIAALSTVGLSPLLSCKSNRKIERQDDGPFEWMKLSVAHWGVDRNLRRVQLCKMMGVTGGVSGGGRDIKATAKAFSNIGLEWTVLEGVSQPRVHLGLDGRDEELERFITMIKACAEVGQDVICYNWMPAIGWSRTSMAVEDRGGSTVTAFNIADADTELTSYGDQFTHEDIWNNVQYFLDAVVPVAEQYQVKLAVHPDDPPLARLRGIPRILTSFENLKRFVNMYPSPYNGITFCQGCFSSMGLEVDMPTCIRWFGERGLIHFVHFRDTRGTPENFREVWHDDGPNDMYEAMKAYYEVGFNGPIRPDHVPSITGYEDVGGGYTDLGLLFAVGYMKGLMEAVYKGA